MLAKQYIILFVLCFGLPVSSGAAAVRNQKKPLQPPARRTAIQLPEAHSRQTYQSGISNVTVSVPYKCAAANLPPWLKFDCATLLFSGTPTESSSVTYDITLTFSGADKKSTTLHVLMPVAASADVVDVRTGKYPSFPIKVFPADEKPQDLKVKGIELTSPIYEGTTVISGVVLGFPSGATAPTVQIKLTPDGQMPQLAPIKGSSGASSTSGPVSSDGTFSLNLANPLGPGQDVEIRLVAPSGQTFADGSVIGLKGHIGTEIQKPDVRLAAAPVAGTAIISGWLTPMPVPAVAAISGATPPFGGNYPQISVVIRDPGSNSPYFAPLSANGSTAFMQSVASDGSFSVQLKTPLIAGESVQVVPQAPPGHMFAAPPIPPVQMRSVTADNLITPETLPASGVLATDTTSSPVTVTTPSAKGEASRGFTPVSLVAPEHNSTPARYMLAQAVAAAPIGNANSEVVASALVKPALSAAHVPLQVVVAAPESVLQLPALPEPSTLVEASVPVTSRPAISTTLLNGTTTIAGTATGSYATGTTINIGVLRVERIAFNSCLGLNNLGQVSDFGELLPLIGSNSSSALYTATATAPAAPAPDVVNFNITLAQGLRADDRIQIVQILPANGSALPPTVTANCASEVYTVKSWHRTNLYFAAGVVLSNTSSSSQANANFSQANAFVGLNLDRTWRIAATKCVNGNEWQFSGAPTCPGSMNGWKSRRFPGINTSFDVRLTAIPVSTNTASATAATNSNSGNSSSSSGAASGASAFLTTQRTVRVGATAYAPWILHIGPGYQPGAIFLAPIGKVGFDTLTGAASNTQVIQAGQVTTLNYQTAYNNYSFGGRVGHMRFRPSENHGPEVDDYLDVTVGHYSNLESFICHAVVRSDPNNTGPTTVPTGSQCSSDPTLYGVAKGQSFDVSHSRKRLFRLDIEGLVRVPIPATAIPFYLGFNANIGQHTVGARNLDPAFPTPDDIRIFLGTKFDIGSFLGKLNLGAPVQ